MRKVIAILSILLSVGLPVSAKLSQFIVRGYVQKQDYSKVGWRRENVDSVYVALVRNDTIPVDFKMLVGDDEMKFSPDGNIRLLVQGGVGDYSLILNREGYEPLRHDFKVASEGQDFVYLRGLAMEQRRETSLHEVEVLGTAIKMVMKGDTLVYDSRAFKLAEGSTLDALVRQLPGAELADDGSIKVNGKKVSSLLLNGNDFFKGDPDVALKNLPAYSVDKIKVYDKAAKNDYLTLESHKLSDSPEDENLVMDVTLKKEFSMATILSVEGGYGPGIFTGDESRKFDHRYIGRAFLIGFGKNYRFSAYGNVNNIRNTSTARSSNKDWGYGWTPDGELKVAMGGFDVFYNPSKKLEMWADMVVTDENIDKQELRSYTRFYDTGNLYQRSRSDQQERRNHIVANAALNYMGDNVEFWVAPSVEWMRASMSSYTYSANFDHNPVEASRGAAIDSLFAPGRGVMPSEELVRSVTSSTYRSYKGTSPTVPDKLRLSMRMQATLRPPSARGVFMLSGSVDDSQQHREYGNLFDQPYLTDADASPVRKEQWTDSRSRLTNANVTLGFEWNKRFVGEKTVRTFGLEPKIGWSLERDWQDKILEYEQLLKGIDPKDNPLPSVTAPENVRPLIDGQNTLNSLFLNNRAHGELGVRFRDEPIAPTDSGFNPTFTASLSYGRVQHFRHLSYDKPWLEPSPFSQRVNRADGQDEASASVGLSSNNKIYYVSASLSYRYYTSLVNLFTLVPTETTSDPFNVYLGPGEGASFPNPSTHNVWLFSSYYGNVRHDFASVYAYYSSSRNSTAQTAVFDPATGVTTHRPVAVNGNWNVYCQMNYSLPFGPQECWNLYVGVNYSHNNSVDYVSSTSEAVRSVVRSDDVGGNASISYKLKNGTRFSLEGKTAWQNARSPRESFSTINAWESYVGAAINFYLPWQIEGETSLRASFRRGYEDDALNTTEWLWNASVQKSFIKGALTVKLQAVDILGQLSAISYSVNAQGRTEVWTNSLPRYVMLTVGYRFNFTPKALQ